MSKSKGEAAFVPPPMSSAAAGFQDLADSGEFTGEELREAIDGLDLSGLSRTDPRAFAALAKEVGARVNGMKDTEAVHEVVRAILSGKKGVK